MTQRLLQVFGLLFILYGLANVVVEGNNLLGYWSLNLEELRVALPTDYRLTSFERKTIDDIGDGMYTFALGLIMLGIGKLLTK